MTDDERVKVGPHSRRRRIILWLKDPRVRALLTLLVIGIVAFALRGHYHLFQDGWDAIKAANNWYITVAVVAMALAMLFQAEVMVVLLRSAGVAVKRTSANALGFAANAWSATFPGGPAISAAMIFREQLKWGATPVIASWYMVISGVLSGAGMAILGFGSMFFVTADLHPYSMATTIVVLILLAFGANWVARHPDRVERWLQKVLAAFNRWRNAPEDRWSDKVSGFADQLGAVELKPTKLGWSVILSLLNWVAEIFCLLFCVLAVGGEAPVAGVVLAFITAKLVGQAQVTPGGLGPVDAALTGMLVGVAQMGSGKAFAAVIVFRMISFVGLAIVGWLVFVWTFVLDSRPHGEGPTLRQIVGGDAARSGAGSPADTDGGGDAAAAGASEKSGEASGENPDEVDTAEASEASDEAGAESPEDLSRPRPADEPEP
jgi:uncharacterized protein (TIRG00374 family)